MKVPSVSPKNNLSLNFNCGIDKQIDIPFPPLSTSQQQSQSPSQINKAVPRKIKYGIQIITANVEDNPSSPSKNNGRHQNKALLGANLNPTLNPVPNLVKQNSFSEDNTNSRSPRKPNYLQKSSFNNSLSPNPKSCALSPIDTNLSPIQQYYNGLSPRGQVYKNDSFYEPEQEQDNKSTHSCNQDGPFFPRTKSNTDSKNCFLDSLNNSRDYDTNDYFLFQNVNHNFILNKSNKDLNEGNQGKTIITTKEIKSIDLLKNKQEEPEIDNSQDEVLFDNENEDENLNNKNGNLCGESVFGNEDGIFGRNNAYNLQPFVDNNKIQNPQLPITQKEQGIMFGGGKNLQNNINGFLFEQKQPLQNLTTTLNMNVNPISNSLFNEVNNHNNTNFNNQFLFKPLSKSNINTNQNLINQQTNQFNYNMNLNIATNQYLNLNHHSIQNKNISTISPNQSMIFNINQPLKQQTFKNELNNPNNLSSTYNYQGIMKTHNTNNLTVPSVYRLDNIELAKQAHNLAKDQSGCRFLQKKIEEETNFALNCIYPVILEHLLDTINDQFGNYLIQKFFEYISPKEIKQFLKLIETSFVAIGINQYGTRVIQKLIDFLPNEIENLNLFISLIVPNIVLFSNDINGCHIIQKLLSTKLFDNTFIYYHLDLNIEHIANHKNGCCFLQKCTEKLNGMELEKILNSIDKKANSLIINQYGNYVIQHVMKLNGIQRNYNLFNILINNLSYYSNQKFSSNVIEKFFLYDNFKIIIIERMLNHQLMKEMLFDNFGNYVVQKALANSNQEEQIKLLYFIAPLMEKLKTLNFGVKLYHKIITQYPMIINIMKNLRNHETNNYL